MATVPTAQTTLDNINIAINNRILDIIDGKVEEFSIRDKRVKEFSIDQLRELRKEYQLLASAQAVGGIRKVVIRNVGWH